MLSKLQREFIEHLIVCPETKLTDTDWAKLQGIPYRTVQHWKPGPDPSKDSPGQREVRAAWDAARKEYDETNSILGKRTYVYMLEEAIVNYRAAKKAKDATEARQWWKLICDLTGDKDSAEVRIDYSAWSTPDLEAECFSRGLTAAEEMKEQLRGLA